MVFYGISGHPIGLALPLRRNKIPSPTVLVSICRIIYIAVLIHSPYNHCPIIVNTAAIHRSRQVNYLVRLNLAAFRFTIPYPDQPLIFALVTAWWDCRRNIRNGVAESRHSLCSLYSSYFKNNRACTLSLKCPGTRLCLMGFHPTGLPRLPFVRADRWM